MSHNSESGLFITIDGPNGVGKTSLVSGVASSLRKLGRHVLETQEPTNSPLGQFVRHLEADEYSGRVYACLIAADRYYHLESEVIPSLADGKIVLSARYVDSSLVLQRGDDVPLDLIWPLNCGVLIPNLSIILTASADTLRQRLDQRVSLTRYERCLDRDTELKYYLDAATFLTQHGFNVLIVNNDCAPLEDAVAHVTQQVMSLVSRRA